MTARTTKTASKPTAARTTKTASKPTAEQIAQAKKDVAAQRKLRDAKDDLKAQADAILSAEADAEQASGDHASMFSDLNFDLRSFCGALGIELPSKRRVIVSLVASIIVGTGIAYFGGHLLGMLTAGALVLTGSAFLSMLIYILGICLIAYAAFVAGRKVAQYILTSNVDTDLSAVRNTLGSAKDRVFGWFKSEPKAAAAAPAAAA